MRRTLSCLAALVFATVIYADPPKADPAKDEAKTDKPALPTGHLDTPDWLKASTDSLKSGEIDRLIEDMLKKVKVTPAPLTTDEQFLRRVYVDLTGRLPQPGDITEFLADKAPDKRAKVIDALLDSNEFAKHWAQYFREAISTRTVDVFSRGVARHFELWLTAQFKANKNWGEITREILTAKGEMRYDDPNKNGQAYFLASRSGGDATTEIAAETSRIFLGIQIQCAQCHDHPSDSWKRKHFHEFTAFFARARQRPIFEEQRFVGVNLVSQPFGEHKMPAGDDPKKSTTMSPKFLDGKGPGGGNFKGLSDQDRRAYLAKAVTSKENPWFAGAFVNRIWGNLMGQPFVQPIDDMGPARELVMPEVLARVAGSFRGSDYNIKQLFRDIMTTETYQRQLRPADPGQDHFLFAAHAPTRMSSTALWQSLVGTLGDLNTGKGGFIPKGGFGGGRFGLEPMFKAEFGFDPSSRNEDIEGSISQALILMNNPIINQKIQAKGGNVLASILKNKDDGEALNAVYLRTLARRPTERELARCRTYIETVGNRAEAFEDILWALINSTEYQTKR